MTQMSDAERIQRDVEANHSAACNEYNKTAFGCICERANGQPACCGGGYYCRHQAACPQNPANLRGEGRR